MDARPSSGAPVEHEINGATALVTGGSRGIGRAIVHALAAAGCRVIATGRDEAALSAVRDAAPGQISTLACDLAKPDQIGSLIATLRQRVERLDMLVNNAGVGIYGPADELAVEDWDQMLDVNARGAFLCAQHAFRWMKQGGGGRIINIASVVGHKGYENQVGYTASKHAMMGFTKVMAREGQRYHIRCSAICPGGVATEMVAQARPDLDPAGLIQPADVARAVLYLAREPETCCTDVLHLRRSGSTPFA